MQLTWGPGVKTPVSVISFTAAVGVQPIKAYPCKGLERHSETAKLMHSQDFACEEVSLKRAPGLTMVLNTPKGLHG